MTLYETVTPIHQSYIIRLGEIVYERLQLHKTTDDELIQMFSRTEDVQERIDHAFNSGKAIGSLETETYKQMYETVLQQKHQSEESIKQAYETKLDDYRTKYETMVHKNQSEFERGIERGTELQQTIISEQKSHLEDKQKLLEVYQPKHYQSMKEKGDQFEDKISNELVRQIDRLAYVTDTSDIKGSGDRIIVFPTYKMMIECKNKQTIKKSDIEQFCDHYETDFQNELYQVALFLSFTCEYIVGKGHLVIEPNRDKLVGYLGMNPDMSDSSKESLILYFLSTVHDIQKQTCPVDFKIDWKKTYQDSIIDIHNDILYLEKYELPLVESIQKKHKRKQDKLQEWITLFEQVKLPLPLEIQSNLGTEDIFIDKLIKQFDSNLTVPKLNWKQYLIDTCSLDEFYQKFLHRKGMTRERILTRFRELHKKQWIL